MAPSILHFGQDVPSCLPLLREAGYFVHRYEKALAFCQAVQSGTGYDAMSLCDVEDRSFKLVVQTARSCSRAPLILFRTGNVIPIRAGDPRPAGSEEEFRSEFDLVVPFAAPASTWIPKFDELIARGHRLLEESRRIREDAASVCQASAAAREERRLERERENPGGALNVPMPSAWSGHFDKMLMCKVCGEEFVFTAGEQLFFQLRNFVNFPTQCKKCRSKTRSGHRRATLETTVTCAECGVLTSVPFNPTRGRPVLCRGCFEKNRKRT